MSDLDVQLADHHAAIDEFVRIVRAIPSDRWTMPRAAGAWTPAQIAEHIAKIYEYNRATFEGNAPGRPLLRLLRPLARRFIVDSTLKAGRFTRKGRSPKIFQPSDSPGGQQELASRIELAATGFESALRHAPTVFDHPFFGRLPSVNFVRLQAIHTRHHRAQLPALT
jgi:Protein of unknown function (DUF1569)